MVLSTSSSTATIPNVVATHLVGERTLQIARGQLTLQPTPHAMAKASAAASPTTSPNKMGADAALPSHHGQTDASIDPNLPILLLSVGNATWPLYPSTLFGTHDKDETLYTFLAEMAPPEDLEDSGAVGAAATEQQKDAVMQPSDAVPAGGQQSAGPGAAASSEAALPATKASSSATWIRLTLPAAVCAYKSPVQTGRDKMEQMLIKHGLLKDGFAAAADEIAKSAQQSGQQSADQIRGRTESYLASNPATAFPASFSSTTRRAASGAAAGTATAASYTHAASEAISDLAHSAGAAVGKAFAWTRRASHDHSASTSSAGDEEAAAGGGAAAGAGAGAGGGARVERRPSTGRRISLERFGFGRSKSPNPHSAAATASPPPAPSSQQQPQQQQQQQQEPHRPPTLHTSNPNSQLSTIQSLGEAAEGIAAGTMATGSATLESMHKVIEHDHGPQAAAVAGDAGAAAANTAQVGWDATVLTSTVAHGTMAGKGAYDHAGKP
ncbi:uncharacterized protein PFL1_02022 [Pseudozyma flocculosa PF-1]|uniref:Senescence domain-containing protein n=1 Tax=Pseudozyma flocculosa TaxID=84751 RepID=A0A5C3F2N6_9BASI|nr:uncharacterized protein PFL1_02022 [Pseudozyma flocculosa PF-1]EPQ30496.1 hypothetical protein PFL1_02022 [Pseudozyma flocculosa PF-1]SPO37581.1 uncharacterized protein PSFLO_03056 [Pseudozyma flocculosa]